MLLDVAVVDRGMCLDHGIRDRHRNEGEDSTSVGNSSREPMNMNMDMAKSVFGLDILEKITDVS